MVNLREHEHCSQFVHDFLNIIETRMLVVEKSRRATSSDILSALGELKRRCTDDPAYAASRISLDARQDYFRRHTRPEVAEADLPKNTIEILLKAKLPEYPGPLVKRGTI